MLIHFERHRHDKALGRWRERGGKEQAFLKRRRRAAGPTTPARCARSLVALTPNDSGRPTPTTSGLLALTTFARLTPQPPPRPTETNTCADTKNSDEMRVLSLAVAALAAANVCAAADDKAADTLGSLVPDPFPSLREVGDTIYTTLSPFITDGAAGSGGKLANASRAVKGVINKKTHVASNAKHDILSTLAPKAYDAWLALSAKDFAAWNATGGTTTCDPSKRPKNTAATYSFAFQGSGLLLPFYQGVVHGLQLRGVLDGETMATAKFSGQSGGAITSALTAVGYTGFEQLALLGTILVRLAACNASPPPGGCFINAVGAPIISAAILAKDPDAAKNLSGRLSVWACEVDVTKASNTYSVSQGTNTVGATGWCVRACVCVCACERARRCSSIHPHSTLSTLKKNSSRPSPTSSRPSAPRRPYPASPRAMHTRSSGAAPTLTAGAYHNFFLYLVRCASINHPVARPCISSTRKERKRKMRSHALLPRSHDQQVLQ